MHSDPAALPFPTRSRSRHRVRPSLASPPGENGFAISSRQVICRPSCDQRRRALPGAAGDDERRCPRPGTDARRAGDARGKQRAARHAPRASSRHPLDDPPLVGSEADRPTVVGDDFDREPELAAVDDSSSRARAVQRVPCGAAATCLTHTSNPTVALPGSSRGYASIEAVRSIIATIPRVERTDTGIVPPTSVSRPPSTSNSVAFSIPTSSESPIGGGTIHWRAVASTGMHRRRHRSARASGSRSGWDPPGSRS